MFINKEEKIRVIATGSQRIYFIKKTLNIENVKLNDVFYIEWYLLKTTQLRRSKIKVICDDCKKIIEKRICDLNINNNIHYCLSCTKKGSRNPTFGKPQNQNLKKSVKKWMQEKGNPFTWKSTKEKIKEKNGWIITAEKNKGKKRSEETRRKMSNSIKLAWKKEKFTLKYTDNWGNIKTEIYKGIEYQSSYELNFLKYIEKLGYLNDIERGPKIRYINKNDEHKIYFCDYRLKNSKIIFEIKSSYILKIHKENYELKENAAKQLYDYVLILDNNFFEVDKKINEYNEIYKFHRLVK
jgi:hypothetical protein